MNRYYVEITVKSVGASRDRVEAMFDPLAEAVCELTGVIDADLGAHFAEGLFDFSMAVDAKDEVSALMAGMSAVRAAMHAVGLSTHGWDDHFKQIQQVVRREEALA